MPRRQNARFRNFGGLASRSQSARSSLCAWLCALEERSMEEAVQRFTEELESLLI